MGFWGNLGKGLLKAGKVAAPIALGATGVGLPAAMAVSGGLNALDKKVSGGSWKDAIGSGITGAAAAGIGAKMPGLDKMTSARTPPFAGGSLIGSQLPGKVDLKTLSAGIPGLSQGVGPSGGFQSFMKKFGPAIAAGAGGFMAGKAMGGGGNNGRPNMGGSRGMGGSPIGNSMDRMDQRAPNLAYPIMAGRQEALMNQPWRQPQNNMPANMPEIYPNSGRGGINPRFMPQY